MSRIAAHFCLGLALELTLSLSLSLRPALAQDTAKPNPNLITKPQLMMANAMLDNVRQAVKDNYYDPTLHGLNLTERYQAYKARLQKAPTLGDAFRIIAAFLAGLDDSHTFFLPPARSWNVYYGFRMRMEGDRPLITAVRPGTDADGKLKPGDEIVSLEGYSVNRKDLWTLNYSLDALEPRGGLHFVVRGPDGATRRETVKAKFVQHGALVGGLDQLINYSIDQGELDAKVNKLRWTTAGDVFVWKLPNFTFDQSDADSVLGRAKKYPNLVLDLRGNPGGAVDDLKYLLGYFVTGKIRVATPQGRRHDSPIEVGPNGDHYAGKLVVVDSGSASAAELFARTVQLQRLGTVVGDTSAGAVMESQIYPMQYGDVLMGAAAPYGASITREDLIMPDGNSLERMGVSPDVPALPAAADLASGRDTVLAKAVELLGGTADPTALGKAFPTIWPPYNN